MPTKAKPKPKRKYEVDEPVSLYPLDLQTALAALLKTPPEHSKTTPPKPSQKSG